jgi:hypothetical protein
MEDDAAMHDADRFALHFGPYRTPRFKVGQTVECRRRGRVRIAGISEGKIPWPVAKAGGNRSLILYDGLVNAVRRESNQAVTHWWGVTGQTVTAWHRVLEVERTEGTTQLRQRYGRVELIASALPAAWAKARDPERRRKIAEAKRGKRRPRHVVEALRAANIGRPQSAATWARQSTAHKRRGTRPPKAGRPGTAAEDELCLTLPKADVARSTGRMASALFGESFAVARVELIRG